MYKRQAADSLIFWPFRSPYKSPKSPCRRPNSAVVCSFYIASKEFPFYMLPAYISHLVILLLFLIPAGTLLFVVFLLLLPHVGVSHSVIFLFAVEVLGNLQSSYWYHQDDCKLITTHPTHCEVSSISTVNDSIQILTPLLWLSLIHIFL